MYGKGNGPRGEGWGQQQSLHRLGLSSPSAWPGEKLLAQRWKLGMCQRISNFLTDPRPKETKYLIVRLHFPLCCPALKPLAPSPIHTHLLCPPSFGQLTSVCGGLGRSVSRTSSQEISCGGNSGETSCRGGYCPGLITGTASNPQHSCS